VQQELLDTLELVARERGLQLSELVRQTLSRLAARRKQPRRGKGS
jgi:hypothetical protein